MATFYIQLENRLLQISGELTTENISKALGYVPVSPNVTNELSQRVDNITFDSLKDNPFLQDGSGELNIVDEAGNIIAKINAEGIHSVDFIAGEHRLSNKTDKTYVDEAVKNVKVDLTGYATEEYVNNIDFYNIKNNPVINSETGKLLFVDESGNIGLQLENDGLYVSNVFAGSHVLSNKADKSEVPTSTSQLTNDSGYITKPVVDQAIASLVDSAPETLDTIGEIASALKNNANIVDVLNQSISAKQNTIEDLEAIRAGASLGATALQEIPEEYVTRDEIPNLPSLDEYAKKEDIPSLDGYATQAWVNNNNYATEEDLSSIEFNSLQNNPLVEDSNGEFNLVDDLGNVGFKVNQEGLFVKDVIAGNHVLSNKANISDIPESITESIVSGWGFTKNTGTYSKPSTGIPKSDLASDVQGVIDNAVTKKNWSGLEYIDTQAVASEDFVYALPDTANGKEDDILLSKNTVKTINGESICGSGDIVISGGSGTITEIKANGTSIATSGIANIPAASTSAYGVTKLNSATNSTSTTEAATPSAVKAAYDLANSYKGTVTGVKINGSTKSPSSGVVDLGTVITAHQTLKTINGESIVGSGDITISGGSSAANVQAVDTGDVLDDVTVDYATKTYVDGLVGDINSILESIINGGANAIMAIINGVSAVDIANTLINTYGAIGSLKNPNPINENIIFSGFTSGVTENQKCEYIYINSALNVIYLYGADYSSTSYCVRISLVDNDPYYGLPQIYLYD